MENKKREEKIRKILKEINENYKQFLKPGSYTGKPLPYKQPDKGDGVQLGATDGTTLDYFICSAPGNFPGGGDTGLGLSFFDNWGDACEAAGFQLPYGGSIPAPAITDAFCNDNNLTSMTVNGIEFPTTIDGVWQAEFGNIPSWGALYDDEFGLQGLSGTSSCAGWSIVDDIGSGTSLSNYLLYLGDLIAASQQFPFQYLVGVVADAIGPQWECLTALNNAGVINNDQTFQEYYCCDVGSQNNLGACYDQGCPEITVTTTVDVGGVPTIFEPGDGDTSDGNLNNLFSSFPPNDNEDDLIALGICPPDAGQVLSGCTDSQADNYDPDAEIDDGSCTFDGWGFDACGDPNADNFYCENEEAVLNNILNNGNVPNEVNLFIGNEVNPTYDCGINDTFPANLTSNDGMCEYEVCEDENADNYNLINDDGDFVSHQDYNGGQGTLVGGGQCQTIGCSNQPDDSTYYPDSIINFNYVGNEDDYDGNMVTVGLEAQGTFKNNEVQIGLFGNGCDGNNDGTPDPDDTSCCVYTGCTESGFSNSIEDLIGTGNGVFVSDPNVTCENVGCIDDQFSVDEGYCSNCNVPCGLPNDPNECCNGTYGCMDTYACNYIQEADFEPANYVDDSGDEWNWATWYGDMQTEIDFQGPIPTSVCIYPENLYGADYLNCDGDCINDMDGDGICDEEEIGGCTDSLASNYNPNATDDDGSCVYPPNITAANVYACQCSYLPFADTIQQVQQYGVGFNDLLVEPPCQEFNNIMIEDGNDIIFPSQGDIFINEDECNLFGCTDSSADNYSADANIDFGCYYEPAEVIGCMHPMASNYDPAANVHNPDDCIMPISLSSCYTTYCSANNFGNVEGANCCGCIEQCQSIFTQGDTLVSIAVADDNGTPFDWWTEAGTPSLSSPTYNTIYTNWSIVQQDQTLLTTITDVMPCCCNATTAYFGSGCTCGYVGNNYPEGYPPNWEENGCSTNTIADGCFSTSPACDSIAPPPDSGIINPPTNSSSGPYNPPNPNIYNPGGSSNFGQGCFTGETLITMEDGSTKRIDSIELEDIVKSEKETSKVIGIDIHKGTFTVYSINGNEAFVTAEHPFKTINGWKAIDPLETFKKHKIESTVLEVGDVLITKEGTEEIKSIEASTETVNVVYNLKLDNEHVYYTNEYLVHNTKEENPDKLPGGDGGGPVIFGSDEWFDIFGGLGENTILGKNSKKLSKKIIKELIRKTLKEQRNLAGKPTGGGARKLSSPASIGKVKGAVGYPDGCSWQIVGQPVALEDTQPNFVSYGECQPEYFN